MNPVSAGNLSFGCFIDIWVDVRPNCCAVLRFVRRQTGDTSGIYARPRSRVDSGSGPSVPKAIKMDSTISVYGTDEANPLAALGRMFAEKPPEFIGTREINGRSVEVYRYVREPRRTMLDVWIDSRSGSLFAIRDPGSDQLDMSQLIRAADAPARRERGRGRMAGAVRSDIRINEPLNGELFKLEVPESYQWIKAPALPGGPLILQ